MLSHGTSAGETETASSVRDSIAVGGGGGDDPDTYGPAPQLEDDEVSPEIEASSTEQKPADVTHLDFGHLGQIDAGREVAELVIDDRTAVASWFASKRDRRVVKEMAKSIVRAGEPGHFLVRDKASDTGLFALALNAGPAIMTTYLIETRGLQRRFAIMGTTNESFATIAELIDFYAEERRGSLGHKLILPGAYLAEVRDQAEDEVAAAPVKEEAYLDVSGAGDAPGLPKWLQVDPRIKEAIRNSMRDRVKTEGGEGREGPATASIGEYLETEGIAASRADAALPKEAWADDGAPSNSGGFNGAYSATTENGSAGDGAMFDFDQTNKAYDVMRTAASEGPTYELGDSDQTYDMASPDAEGNEGNEGNDGNPTYTLATTTPAYDKLGDDATTGDPDPAYTLATTSPAYDKLGDAATAGDPDPDSKIYDDMVIPTQDSLLAGRQADDDEDVYKVANAQDDEDQNLYLTPRFSLLRQSNETSDTGSEADVADASPERTDASPERTAPGTAPRRRTRKSPPAKRRRQKSKNRSRAARLLGSIFRTSPNASPNGDHRDSTLGIPMASRTVSGYLSPPPPRRPSPRPPKSPSPQPPSEHTFPFTTKTL